MYFTLVSTNKDFLLLTTVHQIFKPCSYGGIISLSESGIWSIGGCWKQAYAQGPNQEVHSFQVHPGCSPNSFTSTDVPVEESVRTEHETVSTMP